MGLTTDPDDPCLKAQEPSGQNSCYLVLSEEERAKGFIRPVRTQYRHVGCRPAGKTRSLTEEEQQRYAQYGYVLYEEYSTAEDPVTGRFWTKEMLTSGCGAVTSMGEALAETYARQPSFYGATFCCVCNKHFPVGEYGEFIWLPDGERVGT